MSRRVADQETRALASNPVFRRLIAEGRDSKDRGVSADELDRRRPMAPIDREYAEAFGTALGRLESAQRGEVTDEQGRVLKLIITAADLALGRAPLDHLAKASGIDAATLEAAAVALEVVGVRAGAAAVASG